MNRFLLPPFWTCGVEEEIVIAVLIKSMLVFLNNVAVAYALLTCSVFLLFLTVIMRGVTKSRESVNFIKNWLRRRKEFWILFLFHFKRHFSLENSRFIVWLVILMLCITEDAVIRCYERNVYYSHRSAFDNVVKYE